jgi:Ser/Thr protein kinase RdoA (MazF antagonist)
MQEFYRLSTDHVLDSVEKALLRHEPGRRATGSILALNSLENRVYQIEFEDGVKVVTKFYRPGRWSFDQLIEEHRFLKKLQSAEVPVIVPLELPGLGMQTLAKSSEEIHFAVFPYFRGRLLDELQPVHLQTLGRYVGRIHRIGAGMQNSVRQKLTVQTFGWEPLGFLFESDFFPSDAVAEQYEEIVARILNSIEFMFEGVPTNLVHGDCHLGNTLWQEDAPVFLDFDDACLAPAVQDVWMIVRGRDLQAQKDREILLASYEQMNEFNSTELSLIEPLRALRIIHYSAWIAQRWGDPSFPNAFPDFGSTRYWHEEISELHKIYESLVLG